MAPIAPAVVLVTAMVGAVNLAIPSLQSSSLHPSVPQISWIVDSYTVVFACLLIPAGALGDRFGRKRGMLIGLAIFTAGSALAALSTSVAMLMSARALSGAGAALVMPASLALSLARVEPQGRPHAIALWSGLSGVAAVFGYLTTGLALQLSGWPMVFWLAVPIAVGSAAVIAIKVPSQAPHDDPVDVGGGLLLTAGTAAFLFVIIEGPNLGWASWQIAGSFLLAIALLTFLVAYEVRTAHPMLDPRVFRLPTVRAGTLGITVLFIGLFGLFYVNSQYLQEVKGFSPLLTGFCVLPMGFSFPLASARSTRVVARLGGRRTIVLGMLVVAFTLGLLSFATRGTPYPIYGTLLFLVGVGMGLALPPLSGMIVHALPSSHAGVSSGLNSTTRELGSALGVAVFGTLLVTRFSDGLPAALREAPAATRETIEHSVAAALRYAGEGRSPEVASRLVEDTREAFNSGISLGLRVGALLLLLTTFVVARQHPDEKRGTE